MGDRTVGGKLAAGFNRLSWSALLGAAGILAASAPAAAQSMREVTELPADCGQSLPPQIRGTLQPWQVYVRVEHCDRMKRLRTLSALLPPDQRPRFFEGLVSSARLPSDFGVDLPVLRVVFPERTFFDTNKSALRDEAHEIVGIIVGLLRTMPPDVSMFVAGHADMRGEIADNYALSERRANAVATAVYHKGVNTFAIWRIGFGEDMPLHSGTSEADLGRNRRVEFLFAAKPEAVGIWLADQQIEELCQPSQSTDLADCREKLVFRKGYDAEVVNPSGPALTIVRPVAPVSPVRVKPTGQRARRLGLADSGTKTVAPRPQARSQVIPSNTRKIRIDPVNPDSTPVTVIL